ncbi:hypothetical protein GCM10029992_12280 [Glycomyces albus]
MSESILNILGQQVRFASVLTGDDQDDPEVTIGTIEDQSETDDPIPKARAIPLFINRKQRLGLMIQYLCCLDHSGKYLTIRRSEFHVRVRGIADPLFRLEYERDPGGDHVPASHIQVHAHRDEYTYFLICSDTSKSSRPGQRWKSGKVPKISGFHFPTGGHRFRPCLEDLLQVLIVEFNIDRNYQRWRSAVRDGREKFRKAQLMASVRDRPEYAVKALEGMGYTVAPPDGETIEGKSEKFTAY